MTREGVFIDLPAELDLPPDVDIVTLRVFNPHTLDWEEWNVRGPTGPAGIRAISGLLSLPPQRSGFLDGNYLARTDGLAVLTATGEPIATQPLRVVSTEEHILTSAGDVIAV